MPGPEEVGEPSQRCVSGGTSKCPGSNREVVRFEIDVAFDRHSWGENIRCSRRKYGRQEEKDALVVAFELEAPISGNVQPMRDEAEEKPTGSDQI